MARKPSGKPTGRPEKVIDWTQFEQLCGLQCTQSEIASMMKVHPNTISDRVIEHYGEDYSTVYKKFCESGKCSLRRNQFVLSKTNASLAIWLGKIWLGQRDTSLDDAKADIHNDLRKTLQEIRDEPRIDASKRSSLETQQPLLDQKFGRDTAKIPAELGAKDTL